MRNIQLLDSTLRDGGYINNWQFGEKAIIDITAKMVRTGIENVEIGFIRDIVYDKNYSLFSSNDQMAKIISPKSKNTKYVGMIDIEAPMPLDKLGPRVPDSIDIIRVIFKKDKIDKAYEYCKSVKDLGYEVFIQMVATTSYSDRELIEVLEKFNKLMPEAIYIVDTFGLIKKKDFLRMVQIADNNLDPIIMLGYHSHNNLQQAAGNAEALSEMNLKRDIIIDACVFGMGRGAGNLNLELFAGYLNENYDKSYRLEPMLEVIDEYLNDIFAKEFWGYSLPYYLSATNNCHPNYAKYFAEKGTLTLKAFNEILKTIPHDQKEIYKKEHAEEIYLTYQQNFYNDKVAVEYLRQEFAGKEVLLIGPGSSVHTFEDKIIEYVKTNHPIVISLNFIPEGIKPDYVFSTHMRRYSKIQEHDGINTIITSNIRDPKQYNFMINFSSYTCESSEVMDNSGIMCLNFLFHLGNRKTILAGLDGYDKKSQKNYINSGLEFAFSNEVIELRNQQLKTEIRKLSNSMQISFLTPSIYEKS
jgi:4-hydroxy 2-oxovalerate aldolase